LWKKLPEEWRGDVALLVGCIAGANQKEECGMWVREAGFGDV
jgi:hypothetical protein